MMEPAECNWLSYVAVPMLVVRAGMVVGMNPMAADLFGCATDAMPVELEALFGRDVDSIVALLQSDDPQVPKAIRVSCSLAGAQRSLMIGARRLPPIDEDRRTWALTLTRIVEAPDDPDVVLPIPCGEASPISEEAVGESSDDWIMLLPAILDQLPVALLIEDENDLGVFVNRGFVDIFEYELAEIADVDDWWLKVYPDPIVREEAKRDWFETLAKARPGDGPISTSEFQIRCGGGGDKMVQFHSFRIGGYRVHSYVDVSKRHQIAVDLRLLADTDALTGALNRRSFFRHAETLLSTGQPLAVLLMDVDHFKQVNDRLGHGFGDQVLAEIAARLRSSLRSADILARLGGEEFAVLLPGHDVTGAVAVAERLRNIIASAPVKGELVSHAVTISVGGCCATTSQSSIDALLLHADHALYAAKRAGRNRVRFSSGGPLDAPIEPDAPVAAKSVGTVVDSKKS